MSGAPSDSYAGGLFRTASAGNLSRRFKALRRKPVKAQPRRQTKRLPNKPHHKRDEVAELLSQELGFNAIAGRMGITEKAARKHFDAIRKQLGSQAV